MGFFSGKRILLLGLLLVLLIGIPLTVFFVQKEQETRSRATAATTLFFALPGQVTQLTSPLQKAVGDTVSVDIVIDPGTNQVSFAKLQINYDTTKLATTESSFTVNPSAFQSTPLEGPLYTSSGNTGNIAVTLSVGADPTKVIQNKVKVATLIFKTIAGTGTTPTQITFGSQSQVLSIASSDQPSENVLLPNPAPASIVITEEQTQPTTTVTPTVNATPTSSQTANQPPLCISLTSDASGSGNTPFTVNFTAAGSDPDGTISKATFNFGDGPVLDVTQNGGIGTNAVNVLTSHIYNTPGTFKATVIFTDNNGSISNNPACSQTITVTASGGIGGESTPTATMTPTTPPTATPTLAPSGTTDTLLKVGLLGTLLSIAGAIVFFAL